MKIWRFSDPVDARFAAGALRGSWTPDDGGPCAECGASAQRRVRPLLLAWEPGSALVGDFVWPGVGEVVCRDGVLRALQEAFAGIEPGPVEVVDDPGPVRGKRRRPRVELPYKGPPLLEIWPGREVSLDPARSSAELEHRCATCAAEQWIFTGLARWEVRWDPVALAGERVLVPRTPEAGLFVSEAELAGADVFALREAPAWRLCTDRVKAFVEAGGFTNVCFLEVGDTVPVS